MGDQDNFKVGGRAGRDDGELGRLVRLLARAAAVEYVRGRAEHGRDPQANIGEQS